MNIFSIDKRIEKLGFSKIEDDQYQIRYERYNKEFKYMHVVVLSHKVSGESVIHSYDPNLHDSKFIGNTNVGLTAKESILFGIKILIKWKR